MNVIIDRLIHERAPWLASQSPLTAALDTFLKFCLDYNNTVTEAKNLEHLSGRDVLNKLSTEIARQVNIAGLQNIPESGSALIAANHPTGIADAIILYKVLSAKRRDLYYFANNDILRVFPQLEEHIAPVEWRKEKRRKSSTQATLRFIKTAIQNEKLGVIFPSGRLAKRKGFKLVERNWMTSAVTVAQKYNCPLIPVHIAARNSYLFYLFDLIHPTLRDITLFKETLNKRRFRFDVNIGPSVCPQSLSRDPKIATNMLKEIVISLDRRVENTQKRSVPQHWLDILQAIN